MKMAKFKDKASPSYDNSLIVSVGDSINERVRKNIKGRKTRTM